uniref:hypothetical protein n=1 Tax=Clostridium sp. NkU-1 TaxID=1095009 RepID=UPI003260F6A2
MKNCGQIHGEARRITAYCRIFFEAKATPGRNASFPFTKGAIAMPMRMAKTGPPTTGKVFPKNHAGADIKRQRRTPGAYFFHELILLLDLALLY